MGKYDHLKSKLKTLVDFSEGSNQRQKMDEVKAAIKREYGNLTPSFLAAEYIENRRKKEALEARVSEVSLITLVYAELITEAYEQEGVSSLTTADGVTVRKDEAPHAVVADSDVFRQWCIDNGLASSLALPWGTTNLLAKERLSDGSPVEQDEEGNLYPMPGVRVFMRPKLVCTGLGKVPTLAEEA